MVRSQREKARPGRYLREMFQREKIASTKPIKKTILDMLRTVKRPKWLYKREQSR